MSSVFFKLTFIQTIKITLKNIAPPPSSRHVPVAVSITFNRQQGGGGEGGTVKADNEPGLIHVNCNYQIKTLFIYTVYGTIYTVNNCSGTNYVQWFLKENVTKLHGEK